MNWLNGSLENCEDEEEDFETLEEFGLKDGSKKGFLQGGIRRNQTDICRHPEED